MWHNKKLSSVFFSHTLLMNIFEVIASTIISSMAALIFMTFFNGMGFGTPPSTALIATQIEDGLLSQGNLIAIGIVYFIALAIVFENGMESSSFYRGHFLTFRTIMGVFADDKELKRLKEEQASAVKERMYAMSLFAFGFVELGGTFFFIEEVTGRYLLNWVAFFVLASIVAGYVNRQRRTLRLSEDKTLIVAEKQARAMQQALEEELEDRDDMGF